MPRTITTLHGTDVTILGSDPSYRETVAFCIDQSDAVTAVSASLRDDTKRRHAGQERHRRDSEFSRLRISIAARRIRRCASGFARRARSW